ncbi:hypothetical protein BV25DRAFT_1833133 [Artomyces pyxidatus]|uniref:Uncharacterized protein n=1 Tax=Artomyces pyxidatus TaxID=48021 RepID=A0ACB8SGY6_9AGAM|nr:hypothetical protein BV25DRAFT_1833133 [Artomyces pyxidatus]
MNIRRSGYDSLIGDEHLISHSSTSSGDSRHYWHPSTTRRLITLQSLVLILAIASFSCFASVFYLISFSLLDFQSVPTTFQQFKARIVLVDVGAASPKSYVADTTQVRYLSYLPHSGFHNQRIAFENALFLAQILNRTLLVPPARLGSAFGYMKSDNLHRALALSGKEGLMHCSKVAQDIALPPECWDYFDFTHVSWDWLVDLSSLPSNLLHPPGLDYPWLHESDPDALTLKDNGTYDCRFVDYESPLATQPPQRYLSSVSISTLSASSARLLQLGTLFGSSRLHLRNRTNIALRQRIREQMALSNPLLGSAAASAARRLGDTYLGAHVRMGDGVFRTLRAQNTRAIWYALVMRALNATAAQAHALEHTGLPPPLLPVDRAANRTPHPPLAPLPSSFSPLAPCPRSLHTAPDLLRLNIPLFISTDSPDPRTDPMLQRFLLTFPCTFFLSDILSAELDGLVSAYDGVPLKGFLLPFVDALVVGGAWAVVGTEGSTFSTYVEDVLWRKSHGWEIARRG